MPVIARYKDQEVINPYLVNRGGWFGYTYLLQVSIANALNPFFIVEAGSESEAIDEFINSQYGHLIMLSDEDLKDWHEDDIAYGGNEGKAYLPHLIWVTKCAVDYGDYLLSEKDEDAYAEWLRDFFSVLPDELSHIRYKLRWTDSIMLALKAEFTEEWRDYVEETNANKDDTEYNKNIAGKEQK